ncbi:hypothetical protein BDV35DRAFT_399088 [Aspergillus flavus]|uniref:BTB domain-containing protein n=1 Tax=Aspergillus flavus TaxID=5059 RepID=A0A5N6GDS5_ASPFL|nr:hypothetical protein BDV35DRAFT_399088 [Aspergillus flavus]
MTTESNLLKLLSNIREDGAFSDLEVRCESSRFQVHRCIVCPQSTFFDKAMKSEFQEAESKEIVIYDDPFIIAKMFDFLYRADYDDSIEMSLGDVTHPQVTQQQNHVETEQAPTTAELGDCDVSRPLLPPNGTSTQTNAKVYVVADKYVIEELKNLSRKKLESRLKSQWSDTEFIPLIEYVYGPASPPKSDLRQVISTFAVQHLSTLKSSEDFHELRRQYPDFAHDFSTIMMERIMQLEEQLRYAFPHLNSTRCELLMTKSVSVANSPTFGWSHLA